MGQYYKPCSLDQRWKKNVKFWMYSHDFKNGLKLMEHSWIGNNFMNVVEALLSPGGLWYKTPIVWAGDYAEPKNGAKENCYSMCSDETQIKPGNIPEMDDVPADKRYILNHTMRRFVDKTKVPVSYTGDDYTLRIHPLSLLTSEGNGQGGGDFRGQDVNGIVGSWARHIISVEGEVPKGFKELEFNLTESF